jgi:hypothetical protein
MIMTSRSGAPAGVGDVPLPDADFVDAYSVQGAPIGAERIGIFPVVSASPERVVMGFDDVHLDFRVVIDVTPEGSGQQVTATTFVRTRNRLGRLYLAAVKPFHRVIVPAMLAQVGRS